MGAVVARRRLQIWYDFASTYTYLSVSRVAELAAVADIDLEWKPFLLGPIFRNQGWNDSPFNVYPSKGAYMWRDMERLCALYRLPWRRPSTFPRNSVLASRVMLALPDEDSRGAFTRAVFRANFTDDAEIADPAVIGVILSEMGQPADELLQTAASPAVKEALRQRTDEAARLGIFGAPTFVTEDGELFWGNDRLEQAMVWSKKEA